MVDDVVRCPSDYLEAFMVDVFRGLGVPDADACVCADILITADKRGIDSHGINRCKPIYYDRIKAGIQEPVTQLEIVRRSATTAVVDGHNGMGHVIGKRCMQMAIDKASEHDMGMVVVRNSTHYGIAGYYALMAAEADMIGITGTNARPSVAPTFGVENMLGTNPLTIGCPSDEAFPFILDCATSTTQRGKLERYARSGDSTPDGLVVDHTGHCVTDTAKILRALVEGNAALLPLGGLGESTGGHKGYGYCTAVEILSSALQCGRFLKGVSGCADGKSAPILLGHFFMAVKVEAFVDAPVFRKNVGDLLRELRASQVAPSAERIYTAGEKEHLAWQERSQLGIPLSNAIRADMEGMRDELGLEQYRPLPWE